MQLFQALLIPNASLLLADVQKCNNNNINNNINNNDNNNNNNINYHKWLEDDDVININEDVLNIHKTTYP